MAEQENEVVHEVAHTVAEVAEEPKVGKKMDLKGWAAVIAAIAALVTSVGSWFKPQDTSVTKNAYETLSVSIAKLSDSNQKNHEDIANLRGYLDGVSHAPLIPPSEVLGPPPLPVPPVHVPTPAPQAAKSSKAVVAPMSSEVTFAITAPPVPTVHAAPAPVQPPSFSDVAATVK